MAVYSIHAIVNVTVLTSEFSDQWFIMANSCHSCKQQIGKAKKLTCEDCLLVYHFKCRAVDSEGLWLCACRESVEDEEEVSLKTLYQAIRSQSELIKTLNDKVDSMTGSISGLTATVNKLELENISLRERVSDLETQNSIRV